MGLQRPAATGRDGTSAGTRSGAGARVVRQLVREMPELKDREEEMILAHDGRRQGAAAFVVADRFIASMMRNGSTTSSSL